MNDPRYPYIRLIIQFPLLQTPNELEVDAFVDTGFDGYVIASRCLR